MEHSSGVLLYKKINKEILFFVCTPDGPFWKNRELWSFPKGHIEVGETPFITALREFKEETSVQLTNDEGKYHYFGKIKQNKSKQVYVFVKEYEGEDLDSCYSNLTISEYPYKSGKFISHHEIKKYAWKTYDELKTCGIKAYLGTYQKILELNGNNK